MPSEARASAPDEAPEEESAAPARRSAFWSGTISFGLVSIPVTLRPAVREGRISLRMLDQDGTPLVRRYYCPQEDKEIPPEQLVRGYEIEKDRYVVITDEELESLAPEKSRDIDLRLFVDVKEINPIYFERAYFLLPDRESTKAYRLLAQAMEETGKAGIATFVMREKEYLVAILAENGILRAETMRFHDEVRRPEDLELPTPQEAPEKLKSQFEKAVEKLTATKLDVRELRSLQSQRMLELVERKRREGRDVVEAQTPEPETQGRDVSDLMAELRRSLERHRSSTGKAADRTSESPAAGQRRKRRPAESSSGRQDKTHPLTAMSKDELMERARKLNIPGRSKMDRRQLERAIRKHE